MRILIAEALAPAAVKLLQQQPGWEIVVSNPKEFMQHLAGADALIVRSAVTVDKAVHPAIVARIKLLSGLKIDEHYQPQDGRFRNEVKLASTIRHPYVIPAIGSGTTQVGAYVLPYYLMPQAASTLRSRIGEVLAL